MLLCILSRLPVTQPTTHPAAMSGQQYEQKAAQIPGALGREVASSEAH